MSACIAQSKACCHTALSALSPHMPHSSEVTGGYLSAAVRQCFFDRHPRKSCMAQADALLSPLDHANMALSPPPAQWVPQQQLHQHNAPAVHQRNFSAELQAQLGPAWAKLDAARQLNGPMSDIAGFMAAVVGSVYHAVSGNSASAPYALPHAEKLANMAAATPDAQAMDNALMHSGWCSCVMWHTHQLSKFWQPAVAAALAELLKRVLSSVVGAELAWISACSLAPFGDSEGVSRYCASSMSPTSAFSGLSAESAVFVLKQALDPSACGLVSAQEWVTWLQLYGPEVAGATEMCLKAHAVPGFLGHVPDSTAAAIMRASAVGSYGIAPARGVRGRDGTCNVFILYKTVASAVPGSTSPEVTRSLMENLGSQGFMLDSGPAKSLAAVVLGNSSSLQAPPQHPFALSPWFHGADISFEATNERLRHAAPGVFFVRLSGSQPRSLVLAFVEQSASGALQVQQSMLQRTADGRGFQLQQYVFTDAADLVAQNSARLARFLPICAEVSTATETAAAVALRGEYMQHAQAWWSAQQQQRGGAPGAQAGAAAGGGGGWAPPSQAVSGGGAAPGLGAAAAGYVQQYSTHGLVPGQPASLTSVQPGSEAQPSFLPPPPGAVPPPALSDAGSSPPSDAATHHGPVPPVPAFIGPAGTAAAPQGGAHPLPVPPASGAMTGSVYIAIPQLHSNDDPLSSAPQQQQQEHQHQHHHQHQQQQQHHHQHHAHGHQQQQQQQQQQQGGVSLAGLQGFPYGQHTPHSPPQWVSGGGSLPEAPAPYAASALSSSTLASLHAPHPGPAGAVAVGGSDAAAAASSGGRHVSPTAACTPHSSFLVPPTRGLQHTASDSSVASAAGAPSPGAGGVPRTVAQPREGVSGDDPLAPPPTLRQVSRTAKQLYDEIEAETGEQAWPEPVPEHLLCPISLQLVRDPVTADDNQTYERGHIQKWLASQAPGQWTSPLTRQPLASNTLRPNYFARSAVDDFLRRQTMLQEQQAEKGGGRSSEDPPMAPAPAPAAAVGTGQ